MAMELTRIGDPLEAHNARTPEDYHMRQAAFLAALQQARPYLTWPTPHPATQPPAAGPLVEWGRWKIACGACANWPSYAPAWQLACCFECGAIYDGLAVAGDVLAIEADLLARPTMAERNWSPE